jgi:hypothetical protein
MGVPCIRPSEIVQFAPKIKGKTRRHRDAAGLRVPFDV